MALREPGQFDQANISELQGADKSAQAAKRQGDYFAIKAERLPQKIQNIFEKRLAFVNQTEEELWAGLEAHDMDFVVDKFLRQDDEQVQLDILGLMIEKRKNEELEAFLSQMLRTAKAAPVDRDGIVIASKSETRKKIFDSILATDFVVKRHPTLESDPRYYTKPETVTKAKAIRKILAFFSEQQTELPGRIFVASETVLSVKGRLFGPFHADPQEFDETMKSKARRQLQSFLGEAQTMYSSLVIYDAKTGACRLSNDKTDIRFREPSLETLALVEKYIQQPQDGRGPIGKSGGYGLQDPEILNLVESIAGDPYTVIGFPFEHLAWILDDLGVEIPISHDWDSIYEKTWHDETLVRMAKEKIRPNRWETRSAKLLEKIDPDDIARLIRENLDTSELNIVELAANVGYFADKFAEAMVEHGLSVKDVTCTDVEVREDIRIKEIDITTIGQYQPGKFNIVLMNNPPGPTMLDWKETLQSIRASIQGKGLVIWISGHHRNDGYGLGQLVSELGPGYKIMKAAREDVAMLLIEN